LPIALIVAVVTEMFMLAVWSRRCHEHRLALCRLRGVFAGIVEIAVIGYAPVKGMSVMRRRLLLCIRRRWSRQR
jgi:hypothetical protein